MDHDAYELGYDTYWEGALQTDNPHDPVNEVNCFQSWQEGWRKARADDYDESD